MVDSFLIEITHVTNVIAKNIISEEDYNKIIEEIKHSNIFYKEKALQNHDYK